MLSDPILDTIVHSSYQPGRCVKQVTIKSFGIYAVFYGTIPVTSDPLHMLMDNCMNVEDVYLPPKIILQNWKYFSAVLTENGKWKLHSLLNDEKKQNEKSTTKLYARNYFACVHFLRETISKLVLTQYIIGKNFSSLDCFKNLAVLNVRSKAVRDMDDFDEMLQYLPHLSSLTIEFSNFSTLINNAVTSTTSTSAATYNDIRDLTSVNYTPSQAKDLTFIMSTFTGLKFMSINCCRK
jgi:hypothetical protein